MTKDIKLSKSQLLTLKKMVETGKSFYQETKALFESDLEIRSLFLEKTVKEIAITIYGEKVNSDPQYAITENRERTALGNAIHNLKKVAKKMATNEEQAEKPTHKKAVNVCNDLDLIAQNWHLYDQSEQNSIAHHLEKLIKAINKK